MSDPPISRSEPMCEFCDNDPVAKAYDAAPARIPFGRVSILFCISNWEACATCAALIDEGRWDDLTERVLKLWVREARKCGAYPDYQEQERLRYAFDRIHAAIRDSMGRTA